MLSLSMILKTGCFLLPLVFGTHYIRTWAFNRYEAVTFECSSAALLISALHILKNGYSRQFGVLTVVLLVAFIGNAFSQWHFYMVLQKRITVAFNRKAKYFTNTSNQESQDKASSIDNRLLTMASVAIMPSFSRFIEESKHFNNPGSFIGLIKSIMKRQRFLKKKYLMREVFAECVNLIGPCKPGIDDMMYDAEHVVPGAVHADDLALDYSDEKKGLFSFDILGFGGLAAIWFFLSLNYDKSFMNALSQAGSVNRTAGLLLIVIVVFTGLSYLLRHFAFARYEVIGYEMSFSSLVAASYYLFDDLISDNGITEVVSLSFWVVLALFLIVSFINHRTDKSLHKEINKVFDNVVHKISPEHETDRAKRKILQNLKTISIWAIVPFSGSKKVSCLLEKLLLTQSMKKFEKLNRRKQEMPERMNEIIKEIVPDKALLHYRDERDGKEKEITPETFKVPSRELHRAKRIINFAGIIGIAVVIVCVWYGILLTGSRCVP